MNDSIHSDGASVDASVAAEVQKHPTVISAKEQVELAAALGPLQSHPAVLDLLSKREQKAELRVARKLRAMHRRTKLASELAELREQNQADRAEHQRRKIRRTRQLVTSDDYRRSVTVERAEKTSLFLVGLVCLALLWSAVNVQHNLMPTATWRDPLWWLSFGAELVVSGFVVALMLVSTTATMWGLTIDRTKIVFFEIALMATTIGLNAGPHVAAGDWGKAGQFSIAPVMIGTGMWLHAWISSRYAEILEYADARVSAEADQGQRNIAYTDRLGTTGTAATLYSTSYAVAADPQDAAGEEPIEIDFHCIAERVVEEAVPSDDPLYTNPHELARVVDFVEDVLLAAEAGQKSEEIAQTANVNEADVEEILARAANLLQPASHHRHFVKPTSIRSGRRGPSMAHHSHLSAQAS
ncbi:MULTISPECIES: hypothetical protein [unclassified Nocardia]|uniref:hypothetical protein n=1 Tax=unclassified Nocardia TaxID=2637762 RepID=UPI001CE4AACD|nr:MULTISPECIES: hypothetical protein [unclassified Nocardia]